MNSHFVELRKTKSCILYFIRCQFSLLIIERKCACQQFEQKYSTAPNISLTQISFIRLPFMMVLLRRCILIQLNTSTLDPRIFNVIALQIRIINVCTILQLQVTLRCGEFEKRFISYHLTICQIFRVSEVGQLQLILPTRR